MLSLFRHELQSRLGAVVGWGIGLALFGALYIGIFPEVGEQMADLADFSIYRALGIDLGSFAGFMASVALQNVPLLLGIFAIVTSTEALAGEEDSGQLELILAMPLKRWQIVSAKGLTAFIILVIAGAGNALVLSAVKATTPVDVTPLQLFGAILNGWPITMAFAMLGLFLSAYLPNRRAAAFTLTVIFVASFFGKALTSLVGSLEPVRRFLLFTYFNTTVSVFTEGIRPDDVALLLGLAALFFILALVSFERRNVTVGAWPWQRPQVESKSVGKQPR